MNNSSNEPARAMVYGATGYTGKLIARHAVEKGLRPVVAGRNSELVAKLAAETGLEGKTFAVGTAEQLAGHLRGFGTVLSCAGPFSQTARPMMEACMAVGADYLDITGEIDVIELAASKNERAQQAGVALIPAVGFDVVPSDCLAAMLAQRLPGARKLELAFTATGGLSRGTAKTMLEGFPQGGRARIDGQIRRVPQAWKSMEIPFRGGKLWGMTIPWGDVASAYYSTGIPNIEVYTATPPKQIKQLQRWRFMLPVLGWWPLRSLAERWIEKNVKGPSDSARQSARSSLWGRVTDAEGKSVSGTLETLSGYHLTALTAVAAMERSMKGEVPRGFSTASQAFGREFILSFPDTDFASSEP